MKIRIASVMLALSLLAGASVASAQTSTVQNPWAYTPMAYFWGNQAVATPSNTATTSPQVGTQTNPSSALDNLFAFMPMFRFFGYTP